LIYHHRGEDGMAKYETTLNGNLDDILQAIDNEILHGVSASFEDGSDFHSGGTRCAVRVYERYSAFGGNRVSLSVTVVGNGGQVFLSAITSGGSAAVFFKVNRLGENAFLDRLVRAVQPFT
jgi:hypothetical protein